MIMGSQQVYCNEEQQFISLIVSQILQGDF